MCSLFPGFCPTDGDDESANSWTKRDTGALSTSIYERSSLLQISKRGAAKIYPVALGKIIIEIAAAAYPSMGDLYSGINADQVLRTGFRLATTYCTSPGLSTLTITSGVITDLYAKYGLEAEHPLDVCPYLALSPPGYQG